jgi:hypothetical protein
VQHVDVFAAVRPLSEGFECSIEDCSACKVKSLSLHCINCAICAADTDGRKLNIPSWDQSICSVMSLQCLFLTPLM